MTSSFKKSLYTILGGALICIAVLTSCENFLRGGEIKQEIEDAIAYNNAKEISVLIQPEEGTGSTVPSGNHKAKKGYNFEVSFSENPAYSFIKWKAVSADKAQTPVTDGVVFEEVNSPITKVKISNDTVAIRIIPECAERIAVSGEPSPRYDPLGVSRDRTISVSFTKLLSESSFIFTDDEIPAGAEKKADYDGNVWAYTYEGQTFLKNISITNNDDYSIAEHFTKPQIDGKLLTICVDKTNPIEFKSNEIFKTVKVTLSKDITDTNNIKMNSSKSWNYQITESTDEKATVILSSVAAEGSVYLAGTKDYSLGQKITLAFTEDSDYQFVKWEYDPQIIYIADPTTINTTATVLDKTTEESPTQIKAVCAPRLRVVTDGFEPVNTKDEPSVSKNSPVIIKFNYDLPQDIAQLNNIGIAVGGAPIKNSFLAPTVNKNTITFEANKSNMIDVPQGQTKTVTVSIPSDLYYLLDDGTKVTYGGNGITFDYIIDSTTLDKSVITFTSPANSGTVTHSGQTNKFSIGQSVTINYAPEEGWIFNGWTVTSGGEAVSEDKIKIADAKALSTTLYVYDALSTVTVIANASQKLNASLTSPVEAVNKKDSDIIIKFNKALDAACNTNTILNKIHISSDGYSLDSNYATRTLEGDTITIKNTSFVSVPKGSQKNITVTIPDDFYYTDTDGKTKVYFEEKSFNFSISHETYAKTKITFKVINGESTTSAELAAAGTIKQSLDDENALTYKEYNIGEDIDLVFELNSGYQFYGWKILKLDDSLVTNEVSFNKASNSSSINTTLTANKESEIKIMAVCYKRPGISIATVSPYNANSATEFAKNEPISLTFDHEIEEGTENAIDVTYSAGNFSKSVYYETSLSSDHKTITLTPKMMLPLNNAYETVTVTVPHKNIYYLAADNRTKITPSDDDFIWSFRVNNTTMTKTVVRFETIKTDSGNQIVVDGANLSTGNKQDLYLEQSFNLEYPIAEGYEFIGWKVNAGTSGYTVSSDTYEKSGTITVKSNNKTFFSLTINSADPTKAVARSYDAIGSGTAGYGINIAVNSNQKPVVISKSPSEGINNTEIPIKMTFNMEMDASKLIYAADKISITYGVASMESYFEAPVLSENGKELTIAPKPIALRDYIKSINAASIDLRVSLKTGITITKDGVSIPLLQNDNSSFTVSYKPVVENTPPSKIDFFATRKSISLQNTGNLSSSDKFVLKQVDSMTNAEIFQNRTKGTVYLYGKYSDIGSGVSTVTVTQRRTKTQYKVTPETSNLTTSVFTKNSTGVSFNTATGGITTFLIPYEITEEDGAILLTVTVEDAAGNKAVTTETFSAIKKSEFYMGEYGGGDFSPYKLFNNYVYHAGFGSSVDSNKEYSLDFTTYKNNINKFVISFDDTCPAIYGSNYDTSTSVCLSFENLTIQMKYPDKNGITRTGTFSTDGVPENKLSYERNLILDVDGYLYGKTMELIITDDMGNVGRKIYKFPSESELSLRLGTESYNTDKVLPSWNESYAGAGIRVDDFIRNYGTGKKVTTSQPIYLSSQTYYLGMYMSYDKTGYDEGEDGFALGKTENLSVCLNTLKNSTTFPSVTLPSSNYSLAPGNTNIIYVTLKINLSSWNSCDKIYLLKTDSIKTDASEKCIYFSKNATSKTVPVSANDMHKYGGTFSIYGIKGSLLSQAAVITVPQVTNTTYDTIPPAIMFKLDNTKLSNGNVSSASAGTEYKGETCNIYISDDWSTPKSGTLTLSDGSTYILNSSNSYTASIPFWKLLSEYDTIYCSYVLYDQNNNKAEGVWSPQIKSHNTCSGTTLSINSPVQNDSYFYIGQNSGSWTKGGSKPTNNSATVSLPASKYIKVTGIWPYSHPESPDVNGWIYKPMIHYTGSASSGNYDYIIQNTDNSILVASDAPVFAQTLVTTRSYEECSTWSAEEWEGFHKHIGDKYMEFSSSDHSPQKYTIPENEINSGECYCVVVHFANNTTAKSTVKKK